MVVVRTAVVVVVVVGAVGGWLIGIGVERVCVSALKGCVDRGGGRRGVEGGGG